MIDITQDVKRVLKASGAQQGVCTIYAPHTTGAVAIQENADPDVVRDMVMELNKIVPFEDDYRHASGNSAAHIKSALIGASQTVPVADGQLQLGRWQGLYFCEFDGPRSRKVTVTVWAAPA